MKNPNEPDLKPTKRHHITIEELKTYKGFENVTDEKAAEILNSIREFCILLCYIMKKTPKNKRHIVDNQHNMIIFESF